MVQLIVETIIVFCVGALCIFNVVFIVFCCSVSLYSCTAHNGPLRRICVNAHKPYHRLALSLLLSSAAHSRIEHFVHNGLICIISSDILLVGTCVYWHVPQMTKSAIQFRMLTPLSGQSNQEREFAFCVYGAEFERKKTERRTPLN